LDLLNQILSEKPFKISTMKWTILLAFAVAVAAGCEKSNDIADQDSKLQASGDPTSKNTLTGTWQLFEYYQDKGDGTGKWIGATDGEREQITFTAAGEVSFSSNSPLANRGFNRYRIVDANHVELYSNANGDMKETFYYTRESDVQLIFNPMCRENCSRRYKLIN
jgi:hypothetical protein